MFLAVHCCTFAAIANALLYRHVLYLMEQEAKDWGEASHVTRQLPFWLFSTGMVAFISGIVFTAWEQEKSAFGDRTWMIGVYIAIGIMSLGTIGWYHILPCAPRGDRR